MAQTKIKNEFEVPTDCPLCGSYVIVKNQYNPPRVENRAGKIHTKQICKEKAEKIKRLAKRLVAQTSQLSLISDDENAERIRVFNEAKATFNFYEYAKDTFARSRTRNRA